jgi:predicted  nucleic acid-binding Zn-ribbon protein
MAEDIEKRIEDLSAELAALKRRVRLADASATEALETAREARDRAQEASEDATAALDR